MWDLASMSIVLSLIYNFCFVWRDKNNIIFLNYRIAAIFEQTKKKTSFIISLRNQHLACFFLTFPFKFFNFFLLFGCFRVASTRYLLVLSISLTSCFPCISGECDFAVEPTCANKETTWMRRSKDVH